MNRPSPLVAYGCSVGVRNVQSPRTSDGGPFERVITPGQAQYRCDYRRQEENAEIPDSTFANHPSAGEASSVMTPAYGFGMDEPYLATWLSTG